MGFLGAGFFDALFKVRENGGFKLGGITFYGALICGLICFMFLFKLFAKKLKFKNSLFSYLNILAPCIAIGHCFGRVGCFLGGCCYGKPTDSIFGMHFPEGSLAYQEYGDVKVFPTELYEVIFLFVLFIFFMMLINRKKFQRHFFFIYLMSYAVVRFLLEFLRGDDRGGLFVFISPAQALSLLILIYATVHILILNIAKLRSRQTPKDTLK